MGSAKTILIGLVAFGGVLVQEAGRPGWGAPQTPQVQFVASETKSVIVNASSSTEASFKAEADNPGWRSQFVKKVGKDLYSVLMAKNMPAA